MVVAVCALTVVFDGYDISVFGTTIPALLAYKPWGLDAAELGVIGSVGLVGMLVGALLCGVATDVLGRKLMVVVSSGWFSICMIFCALAPTSGTFTLFRFLAGIGLGGVMPTVVALATEFAPRHRRSVVNMILAGATSVGTMIVALLGIVVIDNIGFRPMYLLGAVALVVVPLAWFGLPESVQYLTAKGRIEEAESVGRRYGIEVTPAVAPAGRRRVSLRVLGSRAVLGALAAFGAACVFVQLFVYGLNTWLPQLMKMAGYPLGSALSLFAVMYLGAVIGGLGLALWADRTRPRTMALLGFGIGACALLILATAPPTPIMYVGVVLAGIGSIGTVAMLNAFVATWFPAALRASALGAYLGMGRLGSILGPLGGGWIIAAGLPVSTTFYALMIPTVLGIVAVLLSPRTPTYAGMTDTATSATPATPATP
jgi:AAHS family benzoate transporter-like MFS transporter